MKLDRLVTERFKSASGDIIVEFTRRENELPELVTLIWRPSIGQALDAVVPANVIERAAAILSETRRSTPGHWDSQVCPEHGYYVRKPGMYECHLCKDAEPAAVTPNESETVF